MTGEFSSAGARHGEGPLFVVTVDTALRALDLRGDACIIGPSISDETPDATDRYGVTAE
jgi:hypothetical protein